LLFFFLNNHKNRYDEERRRIPDRMEQIIERMKLKAERQGDKLIEQVRDLFHHGIGNIKWGDDQVRVFNAFLSCCLALFYGESWNNEKMRVLRDWGLLKEIMYALVNMARRNGKTYVTSGTASSLLMVIPGIKIAIFSTCRRTSQMMMTAMLDMIELIFDKGTHANRQDFVAVTKNMESVCFEGPDRTKRIIGSFPGSVRVS
jgi:hypothetical protein